MESCKLSIVIAMYNLEGYIEECLQSCLFQENVSPSDYEIIVVDDGSTDGCGIIVKKYVELYSNLRLITRENGGLSVARNTGLANALGEFIWYVDGDDKIASLAVSTIIKNVNEHIVDLMLINFHAFDDQGIQRTSHFRSFLTPMKGSDIHDQLNYRLPSMAWLTIFRRSFQIFNNLEFYPGIIFEDMELTVKAHHLANSLISIREPLYFYRLSRPGSIMSGVNNRRKNTKEFISSIRILQSHSSFFKKKNKFSRYLLGIDALLVLKKRYSRSFEKTTDNIIEFDQVKSFVYCALFLSPDIRYKLFSFFYILPESVKLSVATRLLNRSVLL